MSFIHNLNISSIYLCSIFFCFSNHPMLMVIFLIIQAMLSMMMTVTLQPESWVTFILFLIYLGGLIIIFVYLSSVIPNEVMNSYTKTAMALTTFFFMLMMLPFFKMPLMNYMNILTVTMNNTSSLFSLLLIYLLVAMCLSVLISSNMKTPLKQELN